MKHTIIYNNITNKLMILDFNNQIISDIIYNNYLLNDINFNTLPSNVLNDVKLYLGKEYESYNNVDINEILELLFNKDNIIDDDSNYFNKNGDYLYNYDQKNKCLCFGYTNIYRVFESKYQFKNNITRCLLSSMVEQAFKWKVITTTTTKLKCKKWVEQAFKWKVITTCLNHSIPINTVEQAFK